MKFTPFRDRDTPYKLLSDLQPLRVPAGWVVGLNSFYVSDAFSKERGSGEVLYLMNRARGLTLDVTWSPEFDPKGAYVLSAETEEDKVRLPGPVDGRTRERAEVVTWLQAWLASSPEPSEAGKARALQPLRLTSGWEIVCNEIAETVPDLALPEANPVKNGGVAGARGERLLFRAVEAYRRFRLDAGWRTGATGAAGYFLELRYCAWRRDARGRRVQDVPLSFDEGAHVMHRFEAPVYSDLVGEVERWIWRAGSWPVEGH